MQIYMKKNKILIQKEENMEFCFESLISKKGKLRATSPLTGQHQ